MLFSAGDRERHLQTLILSMLGLGLAIAACSPVSVVTVIVLLSMPAGRRRAFAFVAGWLLAIAVVGVVVYALHGEDFRSRQTTPSRAASVIEILLGCIAVLASVRALRRRTPKEKETDARPPAWLDRLDQTHWLLAVLAGSVMLTYSLTVIAAIEVLKANVSTADAVLALVVFAVASIASIVAPILLVLVRPERSEERLARLRQWLLGNARTIGLIALIVIGCILIARGLHDLIL